MNENNKRKIKIAKTSWKTNDLPIERIIAHKRARGNELMLTVRNDLRGGTKKKKKKICGK